MSVLTKKYFDTPKVIQIEITNRCPYNCAGCYKSKKTKDMNLDVFRKVINEAVTINVKSIMFNGGEPMVVENLKEMINYVNHRIPITIFTSGYNIDEKWIDFFMVHNVRLYISINGSTSQLTIPRWIFYSNDGNEVVTQKQISILYKLGCPKR